MSHKILNFIQNNIEQTDTCPKAFHQNTQIKAAVKHFIDSKKIKCQNTAQTHVFLQMCSYKNSCFSEASLLLFLL